MVLPVINFFFFGREGGGGGGGMIVILFLLLDIKLYGRLYVTDPLSFVSLCVTDCLLVKKF